ncbi:HEPN domain-containing protein [Candidatus Woesearchaeota archaeon]|nr:HEPN domain-containing protein [Candidatus Woesearchaeota archaeon]
MTYAEKKLNWCLKKAEKEGRKHRGLHIIAQDTRKADDYIKKAEHNLEVMRYLISGGFNDWAISASFYAHYHCLSAILQKFGYESRNQECTFVAIEHLIEQGKISLQKADLYKIFASERKNELEEADIVDLRERFQYGTETLIEKERINALLKQTINFIEKTKGILQT